MLNVFADLKQQRTFRLKFKLICIALTLVVTGLLLPILTYTGYTYLYLPILTYTGYTGYR